MLANVRSRLRRARPRPRIAVAAVAVGALLILAPGAAASPGSCRAANTPIIGADRAQMQRTVVCLIDARRRAYGLPDLAESPRLNRSAQGWTDQMVSHRTFEHGADFSARISAVGFNWSDVGENIATGFETPAAVVGAWMASRGHCENILSPLYRQVGSGVSDGSIPGFSNVAGTWTQDFGLQMGQPAASGNWGPASGCPYTEPVPAGHEAPDRVARWQAFGLRPWPGAHDGATRRS